MTATVEVPKMPRKAAKTRAVVRDIEAGSDDRCVRCGERIKFRAKKRMKRVICNIYKGLKWNRVELFHAECYEAAGEPHGTAEAEIGSRRKQAEAAAIERRQQLADEANNN